MHSPAWRAGAGQGVKGPRPAPSNPVEPLRVNAYSIKALQSRTVCVEAGFILTGLINAADEVCAVFVACLRVGASAEFYKEADFELEFFERENNYNRFGQEAVQDADSSIRIGVRSLGAVLRKDH